MVLTFRGKLSKRKTRPAQRVTRGGAARRRTSKNFRRGACAFTRQGV
jgi:hypothetical protein